MCYNFFIHSSVDRHLGYFHVLAIVNSAAMNIGVHVSYRIVVFQGICPVVVLLSHMVILFWVFKEISVLFFLVAVSIYISTNNTRGFPFLHILSSIYCL